MVLDKKCGYFIYVHIHIVLCSVWWSVRYGHKRGHRRDSGKQLCPTKKEAGILHHAEQQGRSGGRRGRSERKIKARTFTGARKIRKGRIKFEIG